MHVYDSETVFEIQFRSTSGGQSVCAAAAPECTCVLEREALLGSTAQSPLKVILLESEFSV